LRAEEPEATEEEPRRAEVRKSPEGLK